MNPLAVTQRERIRQHNEQEDQEMQERTNETKTEDVHVEVDKHPEKEKRVYFLPKCFCLLIAVLALLAAVVVGVYYFRDKTSVDDLRGSVTHDKKPIEECHGISVELGDTIVIKCSFSEIITEEVVAIYKNVAGAKTSDFQCLKSVDEKNVTCTANNVTTCSSDGKVELRFLDKKKVKFTKTVRVNVTVPSSSLTTSLRQIFVGNDSNFFNLTCEYTQDCSNHVIKFLGEGKDLAGTRTCTTTYSNKDGYSIKCNAIISGQVFLDQGNKSSLNCTLMDGSDVVREKEFVLPSCDYKDNETDCSSNNTTLNDCDDPDTTLDNCTDVCRVAIMCYSARVLEFSTNSTACPLECSLGWCRHEDTYEIDTTVDKLCQTRS